MKTSIKLVELDNKSRTGLYIYVKSEGVAGRYYKATGSPAEIDVTKQYYEDRYVNNKPLAKSRKSYQKDYWQVISKQKIKRKSKVHKQAENYAKRISKGKSLKQQIKLGMAQKVIKDMMRSTDYQLQQHVKSLLSGLVLDKDLLEMITKPENLRKIKTRFEYRLRIKDEISEQTIATASFFNKTPVEMKRLLSQAFNKGELIENTGRTEDWDNKIDSLGGEAGSITKKGNLGRIEVLMIFRRGK